MASTSCQEEVLGEQSDALRDTPQSNLPISYSNADTLLSLSYKKTLKPPFPTLRTVTLEQQALAWVGYMAQLFKHEELSSNL